MAKNVMAPAALGAVLLLTAGCSSGPEHFVTERSLDKEKTVITDARTRLTNIVTPVAPTGQSVHGRVVPSKIVCAEPSPDVATTLSQAITASFAAAGEGKGISAQAAAQFGKSLSEGLVQMTERTATMQLLRDSLHRACEAYANGALSDVSYSLLMSRYDELMVTLLTGELTANQLGRQLAAISGEAGHVAGLVQQDVAEKQAAMEAADEKVRQQEGEVKKAREAEQAQQKAADDAARPGSGKSAEDQKKAQDSLKQAQNNTETQTSLLGAARRAAQKARTDLLVAELGAQAGFAKTTATAAGKADGKVSPQLADRLVTLHDRFMQPSTRGLFISCVTVLDRPAAERSSGDSQLVEICKKVMNEFKDGLKGSLKARATLAADKTLAESSERREHQLKISQTVSGVAEAMAKACSEAPTKENATACMQNLPAVIRALSGAEAEKPPAATPPGGGAQPAQPKRQTGEAPSPASQAAGASLVASRVPRLPVTVRPLAPAAN